MARKIEAEETLDDLRYECDYTRARLEDEPDAKAFLPTTDPWLPRIEDTRVLMQAIATAEAQVNAGFTGANIALDWECADYGGPLWLAVKKDRSHPRWRAHFGNDTLSEFNRQDFKDQTRAVRGWVNESQDPSFLPRKDRFAAVATRAEAALAAEANLKVRRGTLWQKRSDLAKYLTDERDALHDELSAVAREKGYPRSWPDTFFRVKSSKPSKAASADAGPAPAGPTTPEVTPR